MSARTNTFTSEVLAREPMPAQDEPPRKLARGSTRVVTADVTADLPRREPTRVPTPRHVTRRDPTVLAAALLAAYLGQAVMGLEVPWLVALQGHEVYKLATGGVLIVFLAMQWMFARRHRELHVWLGAFAPLALYAHATQFAYGYLAWLVVVYLGVGAVGLMHRPILAHRARRLFVAWFIVHLAFSVLLLVLTAYHVVIAIAYE